MVISLFDDSLNKSTWSQFHQHFTLKFALRSFSLVTFWLCNFLAKNISAKGA